MVQVVETKAAFDALVASGKTVVVDFTATWCGPCQKIGPVFASMAEEDKSDTTYIKVDVDDNSDTAEACGISAMPTFQIYKGGDKVAEMRGADEAGLKALIAKHA